MKSPSDFSAMDFGTAFDSMNPTKFLESMQQMQQAWSGMGVPTNLSPTMDLDEIDKRIANLKAVEQWLNLNLTMLQSSVQALQVQRSTIATLNNLGDSLGKHADALNPESINKAMAQASTGSKPDKSADSTNSTAFTDPMAWFDMLQKQFLNIASQTVGSPVNTSPSPATTAEAKAKPAQSNRGKTGAASKQTSNTTKRKRPSKPKTGN